MIRIHVIFYILGKYRREGEIISRKIALMNILALLSSRRIQARQKDYSNCEVY
jgi:hypothetical protein